VYFIFNCICVIWAKLPDINKWMDGWIALITDNIRLCLSYIHFLFVVPSHRIIRQLSDTGNGR